mmetsp:Transcript_6375/g.7894  ORF Transcript_6375/g.7894 Transcript_6375/m.7894 type:complete len:134 (-) Transcript_6375:278-679(-)
MKKNLKDIRKDPGANYQERRNIFSRLLCRKQTIDPEEEEFDRVYGEKIEFVHNRSGLPQWLRENNYDEQTSDEILGTVVDLAVSLEQVSKVITDSPRRINKLFVQCSSPSDVDVDEMTKMSEEESRLSDRRRI